MVTVVFLLVPGVHVLDLAGPAQVFDTAVNGRRPYTLRYVAEQEVVVSAQGLVLRAETGWPDLTVDDLVVVPGWQEQQAHPVPLGPQSLQRLREHHRRGGTVAGVCAGAQALGWAGLLDGRRCTTHHELVGDLERRFPRARVIHDVLYVDDDRVLTSAGIASGIDLALHVVATHQGPTAAATVARAMVAHSRRRGDQPQASAMLRHRAHLSEVVHRAQDLIDVRYTERLPLADLAAACGVSARTLTRLFRAATGLTPLRYQQQLRLEAVDHLVGQGATRDAAARAVGLQDARMIRKLLAERSLAPR